MNSAIANTVQHDHQRTGVPLPFGQSGNSTLLDAAKRISSEANPATYADMADGQLVAILVLRRCKTEGRVLACLGERLGVYFRDLCADGDPSCLVLYRWIVGQDFAQDPDERAILARFATGEFDDPETGQKYFEREFGSHIPEEIARFRIFRSGRLWSPFHPRFKMMLQARRDWLLGKVNASVEVQP